MRNVKKVICELCGREISKSNYSKHIRRHDNHPETFEIPKYRVNHDGLDCQFCGKICKNNNSLRNHERLCKENPNRQISSFVEYNNEVCKKGAWNKGLTKETDARVMQQCITFNTRKGLGLYKKRKSKPNSTAYCSKYKYGTYKGYYCDSSWELAFLLYHLDNKDEVIRNMESFTYINTDGIERQFFPDFKINDTFYEIKGGYDTQALNKLNAFPKDKKLKWITIKEIQPYLQYARQNYGKNFIEIYDKTHPSWMDKYSPVNQ